MTFQQNCIILIIKGGKVTTVIRAIHIALITRNSDEELRVKNLDKFNADGGGGSSL